MANSAGGDLEEGQETQSLYKVSLSTAEHDSLSHNLGSSPLPPTVRQRSPGIVSPSETITAM